MASYLTAKSLHKIDLISSSDPLFPLLGHPRVGADLSPSLRETLVQLMKQALICEATETGK